MAEVFRQGMRHPPLQAIAFRESGLVDFPTEFPGGLTFRGVNGSTVVTGAAVGGADGSMTYPWGLHDLDVTGPWRGYFIGTDAAGKTESFPRGSEIEYEVRATI